MHQLTTVVMVRELLVIVAVAVMQVGPGQARIVLVT